MIDISLQNFEAELIRGSVTQPVLLDIWAPWCGPCKALGPLLEKLESAYAGRFKLAKLNSDEQPDIAAQLSQMFGVRSIPLCVLFKEGQPVDGFVGALPEGQIREFLDRHVPGADAVAAEDPPAQAALVEGDGANSIERLAEALRLAPGDDSARYDYLRALLAAGHVDAARRVFEPVAAKLMLDARLEAAGQWLAASEAASRARVLDTLTAAVAADKRDFDARFELAQVHFAAQRWTAAMDELLEILLRDKVWHAGAARKAYVAVLELMTKRSAPRDEASAPRGTLEVASRPSTTPADPVVDAYRRRLSMALF